MVNVVLMRAKEFPQPVRALLLDLPPQHWALPSHWWRTLSLVPPQQGGGNRKATDKRA